MLELILFIIFMMMIFYKNDDQLWKIKFILDKNFNEIKLLTYKYRWPTRIKLTDPNELNWSLLQNRMQMMKNKINSASILNK